MECDRRDSSSRRLVYREKAYPIFGIPLFTLGVLLVCGSAFSVVMHWLHEIPLFGEHGIQSLWGGWILEIIILGLGWKLSTSRRLVFDKNLRKITLTTGLLSWGYSKTYTFDEFDSILWNSHTTNSEDGSTTNYSVVLADPRKEVVLFETSHRKVAQESTSEIAEFMGIAKKQGVVAGVIPLSTGTGLQFLKGFSFVWQASCAALFLFGIVFLAGIFKESMGDDMKADTSLGTLGFSFVFLSMAIVMFFVGRKVLRTAIDRLEEELNRERAMLSASRSAAAATDSYATASLADASSTRNPAWSEMIAQWGPNLLKGSVRTIPFLLFVYFTWGMFHDFRSDMSDNQDVKNSQAAKEKLQRKQEIATKWRATLRANNANAPSPTREELKFHVYLHGNQGQEITGLVDTAQNTFMIHTWSDPQKKVWTPLPEELPITLYAFDSNGDLYDVPDNWNGMLKQWAFLLPPVKDITTIRWDRGAPTSFWEGASFGWGGFRNSLGKIAAGGSRFATKQFSYVPYKESGMSSITFDETTITRLSTGISVVPQPDQDDAQKPNKQLATKSRNPVRNNNSQKVPVKESRVEAHPVQLVVQGTITHAGVPIQEITEVEPSFWFRDEAIGKEAHPKKVHYKDGAFQIYGLAPGDYGVAVSLNANLENPKSYPGDYRTFKQFAVNVNEVLPLVINMPRIIRLRKPQDNNTIMEGWDSGLTKASWTSPVVFEWESLGEGVAYRYQVQQVQRNPWKNLGIPKQGETNETRLELDLSASEPGQFYLFRLNAYHSGRRVGMIMTHGAGGYGWDFRFRVKPTANH